MGGVIGDLLPLAVGVAISPIPIIATILMLLAPKAGSTSVGFLIGWVVGIVVATVVFTVIAATAGLDGDSSGPSSTASWIKIVLGVLLLLLAVRQWRSRPRPGEDATLPKWMSAIDSFTVPKALGLGFLLSAVNPKNLLMCVAAGTIVGGSTLATGEQAVAVAVYTTPRGLHRRDPGGGLPRGERTAAWSAGGAPGVAAAEQCRGDERAAARHRRRPDRQGTRRTLTRSGWPEGQGASWSR